MAPHSSTLAWKIPWRRSLVGCSPWGREESDTTERLDFHFSLSCIGEGNGNPLQCSCLENPRDVAAWWAAVYGVTQSRTRLKRLSSSSSSSRIESLKENKAARWVSTNGNFHQPHYTLSLVVTKTINRANCPVDVFSHVSLNMTATEFVYLPSHNE